TSNDIPRRNRRGNISVGRSVKSLGEDCRAFASSCCSRDEDITHGSTPMVTFVDRHRSDFNFNNSAGSFADILWRDSAGNDAMWLMNSNTATTITALPFVTPDWHFKAAADFDEFGNGDSDILWQNDNGALVLWQMQGATVAAVNALPNPGPTWHVV